MSITEIRLDCQRLLVVHQKDRRLVKEIRSKYRQLRNYLKGK